MRTRASQRVHEWKIFATYDTATPLAGSRRWSRLVAPLGRLGNRRGLAAAIEQYDEFVGHFVGHDSIHGIHVRPFPSLREHVLMEAIRIEAVERKLPVACCLLLLVDEFPDDVGICDYRTSHTASHGSVVKHGVKRLELLVEALKRQLEVGRLALAILALDEILGILQLELNDQIKAFLVNSVFHID
jgi:hypothetical protein